MHGRLSLTRHRLFVPALWIALATAVLCAICPAGLPLSKSVGSAFSPSTTLVALRQKAEHVRETEQVAAKAKRTHVSLGTTSLAGIVGQWPLLAPRNWHRQAWRLASAQALLVANPATPRYPTGPPRD